MSTIGNLLSKINLEGSWQAKVPLSEHTTFRVGGPAEAMVFPQTIQDVVQVVRLAQNHELPLFVLGRGANLLVADQGIPGITLNLCSLQSASHKDGVFRTQAGLDVSAAAELGRREGFSCLEFLNAMPSTVGGAVYMNARCYGAEIADVFLEATILDSDGQTATIGFEPSQWSYKHSPFQDGKSIILEVSLRTRPADPSVIGEVMIANASDREAKGHFRLPCAGSVFKNNYDFGAPSGVLIDRAGLKGLRVGNALVSAWHGNIIVNEGAATATEIRSLINMVKQRVWESSGFRLEEEVIFVGHWPED